jgi:hypothetical protein
VTPLHLVLLLAIARVAEALVPPLLFLCLILVAEFLQEAQLFAVAVLLALAAVLEGVLLAFV